MSETLGKELPNHDEIERVLDQLNAGQDIYIKSKEKIEKQYLELSEALKGITAERDTDRKQIKLLQDALAAYETKAKRPGAPSVTSEGSAMTKAFTTYCRTGDLKALRDQYTIEHKAMMEGDDTRGAYLVPPEWYNQIVLLEKDVSPVRAYASVQTIGSSTLEVPRETALPSAHYLGEDESDNTSDDPDLGNDEIHVRKLKATIDVSNDLLEDNAYDLEGYLQGRAAFLFAIGEGNGFVNGTGNKMPEGMLTNPSVPIVNSKSTNAIATDDITALWETPPTYYDRNGAYYMNKHTEAAFMRLKDTLGRPLWQNSIQAGMPPVLNGVPVRFFPDMPNVATGNAAVLYADMQSFYLIADRVGMTMVRDVLTRQQYDQTRFIFRERHGGAVRQTQAGAKLVIS